MVEESMLRIILIEQEDFYFLLCTEDSASYNKLRNTRTSKGSNFNELLNPLVNQTMVTPESIIDQKLNISIAEQNFRHCEQIANRNSREEHRRIRFYFSTV
jgi:hypothetical protein